MKGWLPEGFQDDAMARRGQKAASAVRYRIARRARVRAATVWAGALLLVLAAASLLAPRLDRPPAPRSMAVKAPPPAQAEPASAMQPPKRLTAVQSSTGTATTEPKHPASSPSPSLPDISLTKKEGGVELKWSGASDREYVIYRCTSPRFDRCDVAGVVKGTEWTDREAGAAPLVFYKVEPKSGA